MPGDRVVEWWPKSDRRAEAKVFEPTGEPVGATEWRRWRTASGWHSETPAEIVEEYGWLFEYEVRADA